MAGEVGADWSAVRRAGAAVAAALVVAVATGVPTDVIPNAWFTRMTPTPWWAQPTWVATWLLTGVFVAVSVGRPRVCSPRSRGAAGVGTTAGWLAIGCPICNKIVVALLGVAGAMTWFAPLQPWLAVSAPVLLVGAIWVRVRQRPRAGFPPSPGAVEATEAP